VYFLDLDPEHPEYSPHGQISLTLVREINLGPSYTHPTSIPGSSGGNETIRSHAIPLGNFANFQEYFISCLENLYHTYTELQERNPSIPLIINIPGWVYTTSFNILLRMLSRATPQRLVHLRDLDTIDEERAIKFHNLNSEAARNRISVREISAHKSLIAPLRTEDELRSMQMLSYFHCTGQVTELETARFDYDYKPLSNMTPWEFHYKETENSNQTFVGFLNLAEWVEPRHLFTALNGSIIQIIETEDENVQDLFGELPRTNKYRIPYFDKGPNEAVEPLDPQSSRLVCTALLRGWDPENRVAQLLVPKTHEVLLHGLKPEKTVLVFGCCDTPEWAFTEDAYYNAAERKMDGEAGDQLVCGDVELPPWVARDEEVKSMGYLNAVRRIRKYQQ
jgi:polynucleotide 5'-hydroxyl-kinase GRC3/NOL9